MYFKKKLITVSSSLPLFSFFAALPTCTNCKYMVLSITLLLAHKLTPETWRLTRYFSFLFYVLVLRIYIFVSQAVTFLECKSLIVANLRFQNAQQMHLSFQNCVNVRALNLMVIAPGTSPNTDGIHVTGTQNIRIRNCVIRTGKHTTLDKHKSLIATKANDIATYFIKLNFNLNPLPKLIV